MSQQLLCYHFPRFLLLAESPTFYPDLYNKRKQDHPCHDSLYHIISTNQGDTVSWYHGPLSSLKSTFHSLVFQAHNSSKISFNEEHLICMSDSNLTLKQFITRQILKVQFQKVYNITFYKNISKIMRNASRVPDIRPGALHT